MTTSAARLPGDLPGLDSSLSKVIRVAGRGLDAGTDREWHYLDTGDQLTALGAQPVGTILAVHGNPTWAYLWRELLTDSIQAAELGAPAWRVIAVDQLDMGLSERTDIHRPLA